MLVVFTAPLLWSSFPALPPFDKEDYNKLILRILSTPFQDPTPEEDKIW